MRKCGLHIARRSAGLTSMIEQIEVLIKKECYVEIQLDNPKFDARY